MNAKAEIAVAARGNFIDGREVESIGGGTVEVRNPPPAPSLPPFPTAPARTWTRQ